MNLKKTLSFLLTFAILLSILAISFMPSAAIVNEREIAETSASPSDFSWDNATVYFLLIDRFNDGIKSNNNAYNRGLNQNGSAGNIKDKRAMFQGGDFKGITDKINDGYFNELGVNALWITAPYEQVHGYVVGSSQRDTYPHYAYHGYYPLDYTETDKALGTKEEFKTFVDTAHEKGIRVVMDIVMNHPGYNTMYDMNEYNFGTLNSGWQDVYYDFEHIRQSSFDRVINYSSSSSDWGRWWGIDWVRAGLAGYEGAPSADSNPLLGSLEFLPDFKTENTKAVDLPPILKNKWTKEGTLGQKNTEFNNWANSTGNQKRVRNYLVYWLSSWVREYGIDGFRCDTAKHVEMDSWRALNEECTKALKEWKTKNPNKKMDNLDFWMTGENWGQTLDYNDYYKTGQFDSMINFEFGGGINGDVNNIYERYAREINTKDNFNVLTYVSSHDTSLARNNIIYQGSALLLMPGAVQIFYGDESNRPFINHPVAPGNDDHSLRSFMNWSDLNNSSSTASKTLAHWQKVGTFRNNHIAVGAGSHNKLSTTSGSAFSRIYNKNSIDDKIVACIGASANQNVTITLGSLFSNGTTVTNTYNGTTATVNDGKVTFNSGVNGTILIEAKGSSTTDPTTPTKPTTPTTPTTPTKPIDKFDVLLGDADLNGTINITDATAVQKHAAQIEMLTGKSLYSADPDEDGAINVKDATVIQKYCADISTDTRVGQVISIGDPEDPTTPTKPTTDPTDPITDPTDPTDPVDPTDPTTPIEEGVIKFTDNLNWGVVYAYFWSDSEEHMAGKWPGAQMESYELNPFGKNNYKIDIPEGAQYVIFNNNSGSQSVNITLEGYEGYYCEDEKIDNLYPVKPWDLGEFTE